MTLQFVYRSRNEPFYLVVATMCCLSNMRYAYVEMGCQHAIRVKRIVVGGRCRWQMMSLGVHAVGEGCSW